MKRISAVLLALLAFAVPASAQTAFLRGGVNVAKMTGEEVWETGSVNGLNAGLGLVWGRLDLGLSWSQKGVALTYGDDGLTLDVSYIEIAPLYRLGLTATGPLGIHLLVGPTMAYQSSCTVSASGFSSASDDCANLGAEIRSVDWGATGGAGVDIAAGSVKLGLDVLYNRGLRDASASTVNPTDSFNRNWTIRAGLGFPLR